MAKQELQDNAVDANENENTAEEKSGNFLGKYGKIFLIIVVFLVQGGVAYGVIHSYYDDIYHWVDRLSPKGNIYHSFENIIINPANSAGDHYLLLSIAVEVNTEADIELLETQSAKIIDKLNLILTKRTAKELAEIQERERIKQEIGIMINETLDKKAVRNLFFIKYVLQ